jgi:hypothetical protein
MTSEKSLFSSETTTMWLGAAVIAGLRVCKVVGGRGPSPKFEKASIADAPPKLTNGWKLGPWVGDTPSVV